MWPVALLLTLIGAGASLYTQDLVLAVVVSVVGMTAVISDRIAYRRARHVASLRPDFDGTFVDSDLNAIPKPLATFNMIFTIATLTISGFAVYRLF